ncbi:hypothetical protein [Desulforamulus hydrothermalis]|uniref:Uncharacterized protein n=1 Tax=Desulforamulus hydrothermalis Lam5 = DSM 18033 TaxID=1121428 RepID=K8DX59_9FIRM|nr:hypothetical protein [Desulforamulus hydrothermalis]CCO07099.1 conserved hypothetical protein [Desulforamulus hydrothermalis Lam5 = DSM 18033]SHG90175.1 hypothetical protein SAMN02745177_00774 [Desulforamulus hydrothermalis Lam5 = DSM 18033]
MDEKEQLYVDLMMATPGDPATMALISQGYLTEDWQFTDKAKQFIDAFLDEKKEAVFQAFRELGPNARKSDILKTTGIVQLGVLVDVANRLVKEGRLKKENGKVFAIG